MATAIGKYAAQKMLKGELKKYQNKDPAGPYDPYYEYRTNPRTGKKKKYKKEIPSYIPEHDANILASVRSRAYKLDMALFTLFGMRFGWESVIGIIPGFGDVAGALLAYQLIQKCKQIDGGLPRNVENGMWLWLLADATIGLVPFIGDLLDASIKCNTHNCRELERYLDKKYRPESFTISEEMGTGPHAPATVYEEISDDELPQYNTQAPTRPNGTIGASGANNAGALPPNNVAGANTATKKGRV